MDNNARVTLLLTGRSDRGMTLRIQDATSRLPILEVELDAQALLELLTHTQVGGVEGIPAWLTGQRQHLGKYHSHASVSWQSKWPSDKQAQDAWAESMGQELGAASFTVNEHNQGRRSIVLRFYGETQQSADDWATWASAQLKARLPELPDFAETARAF